MAKQTQKLNNFSDSLNLKRHRANLIGGLSTFWSIRRLRWGMLILLLFAPFSKFAYLLFPAEGFGEYLVNLGPIKISNTIEGLINGWYYFYIADYVWSIGELLAPTLIILGVFLLFPQNHYIAYVIGLPFGYYLSLLIYRMFYVEGYQSFHNSFPVSITLLFLVFGLGLFILIDKVLLSNRRFKLSYNNRIRYIIARQDLGWEDKELVLRQEVKKSMQMENETYIRK